MFDLTTTYFLVAGTAGINPEVATIGSVTFARYGVSVEMQYEISPKDLPNNFSGGYIPQGAYTPQEYPASIYGTEAFEYNQDLQHWAAELARAVPLNDSNTAQEYRANYASTPAYAAGAAPPAIYECDVSTSDIYFSGTSLATGFGAYMKLVTNGSAVYCTTEQETTATSESLLRGALINKLDYSRLIVMFAGSDFDRPYAGEAATTNLFWADQGALDPATTNLYNVGMVLIQNILQEWETKFEAGIKATNYVGDIFGTLGGTPDFGPSNYNDSESHVYVMKIYTATNYLHRSHQTKYSEEKTGLGTKYYQTSYNQLVVLDSL